MAGEVQTEWIPLLFSGLAGGSGHQDASTQNGPTYRNLLAPSAPPIAPTLSSFVVTAVNNA